MSVLVASTVDITVIVTIALALTIVCRRRSAALRHAILAAALVASAIVPLLEATLPQWPLPVFAATVVESSPVRFATGLAPVSVDAIPAPAAGTAGVDWTLLILGTWLAGALVCLGGLATGLVRLSRLTSRCTEMPDGGWHLLTAELARQGARDVTVLLSTEPSLVVTCGLFRPKIVLPADADTWSDACRRIVLAHELAHIRRFDWATQILGELLRAVYWFHPLVWIASRRLRHESECACDDAVMARGIDATEYATHLLQIARQAVGQRTMWAAAPAVAHPSTLEQRISAMLKHDRRRDPLTRRAALAVLAATMALTIPVAAASAISRHETVTTLLSAADVPLVPSPAVVLVPSVRRAENPPAPAPAPQAKPATVSGTLYDQLGGLLPGVAVTLTDQTVGVSYQAITNRDGGFVFAELQPATYELTAQLPGFAPVSSIMAINAGSTVERRIVMPIGSLQETITVGCSLSAGPASPGPGPVVSQRYGRAGGSAPQVAGVAPFSGGIGGQIRAPRQIAKANPVCPNHVGVDTVVILAGRIGIDGYLSDIRLLNGASKPATEIVQSAIDAVRLWEYSPTLLNGVPVEVNITMTVFYNW